MIIKWDRNLGEGLPWWLRLVEEDATSTNKIKLFIYLIPFIHPILQLLHLLPHGVLSICASRCLILGQLYQLCRVKSFWEKLHMESFWDVWPRGLAVDTTTKRWFGGLFDIDPNVRLLPQGCHSTRLFKTFPSRRQTPENSAKWPYFGHESEFPKYFTDGGSTFDRYQIG